MSGGGTFRLGSPHTGLLRLDPLAEAAREVVRRNQLHALTYGDVRGDPELRREILEQFADYYPGCEPGQVLLTYGVTEAITLVARTLLRPGDAVVVEAPTYYWALPEFASQGARVIEVPLDESGMRVDLLEGAVRRAQKGGLRVKLIYCMPTFHNPAGATLSLERRRQLLEVARRFQTVILEDDAYFRLRYSGPELPSLFALDEHGVVIHASTFSKVIAPGVRLGWLVTRSPGLLDSLLELKPNGTNPFMSAVVLNYLRAGMFTRHLDIARQFYGPSLEACFETLEQIAPLGIRASKPCGGFYVWLRLPPHWSAGDFTKHCAERGLEVLCGDAFFASAPTAPCVRLAFSSFDRAELRRSTQTLCDIAKDYAPRAAAPTRAGR